MFNLVFSTSMSSSYEFKMIAPLNFCQNKQHGVNFSMQIKKLQNMFRRQTIDHNNVFRSMRHLNDNSEEPVEYGISSITDLLHAGCPTV